MTDDDVKALLEPLGIEVDGGTAIVPTWRPDVEREIDLVEEVARRIGLDRIRRTVPSNPEKIGALTAVQRERRAGRRRAARRGLRRGVHPAAARARRSDKAGVPTDQLIEVENPLRAEESVLRPSLMPGVLRAVAQ